MHFQYGFMVAVRVLVAIGGTRLVAVRGAFRACTSQSVNIAAGYSWNHPIPSTIRPFFKGRFNPFPE